MGPIIFADCGASVGSTGADASAVGIRVADEDELYLQEYIQTGITELKRIAEKHDLQPQDLRVCFAFD